MSTSQLTLSVVSFASGYFRVTDDNYDDDDKEETKVNTGGDKKEGGGVEEGTFQVDKKAREVSRLHDISLISISDTSYTLIFQPIEAHYSRQGSSSFDNDNANSGVTIHESTGSGTKYVDIDDTFLTEEGDIACTTSFELRSAVSSTLMESASANKNIAFIFVFIDPNEHRLFLEAYNNCLSVRDISLRLRSMIRDVYFAGIYSKGYENIPTGIDLINFDHSNGNIGTEAVACLASVTSIATVAPPKIICHCKKNRCLNKYCECIRIGKFCDNCNCKDCSNVDPSLKKKDDLQAIPTRVISATTVITEVSTCFFCLQTSSTNSNMIFVVHPYVKKDFNGRDIMMCSTCIFNWNDYRDKVIQENCLFVPGDRNEDICAICSDSPSELVICSSCVRSYCSNCLSDHSGYKTSNVNLQLSNDDNNEDWACCVCSGAQKNHYDSNSASNKNLGFLGTRMQDESIAKTKEKNELNEHKKKEKRFAMEKHESLKVKTKNGAPKSSNTTDKDLKPSSKNDMTTGTNPATAKNKRKIVKSYLDINPTLFQTKEGNDVMLEGNDPTASQRNELPMTLDGSSMKPEVLYFSQYLSTYEQNYSNYIYKQHSSIQKHALTSLKEPSRLFSDEICFICKDGGELVECDHNTKIKIPEEMHINCRKVYHPQCLSSTASLEEWGHERTKWLCPCHFCDYCGKKDIFLKCLFCPQSVCKKCADNSDSGFDCRGSVTLKPASNYELGNIESMIICRGCYKNTKICDENKSLPAFIKRQLLPSRLMSVKEFLQTSKKGVDAGSTIIQGSSITSSSAIDQGDDLISTTNHTQGAGSSSKKARKYS